MSIALSSIFYRTTDFRQHILRGLREDSPIIALVIFYALAGFTVNQFLNPIAQQQYAIGFFSFYFNRIMYGYFLGFVLLYLLWVLPKTDLHQFKFSMLAEDFRQRFLSPQRIIGFFIVLMISPLFGSTSDSVKHMIPAINPFSWDRSIMQANLIIHGGKLPWQWLQPILERPWLTVFFDHLYLAWFQVMYGFVFFHLGTSDRFARRRFFMTFFLAWVIMGSVLAIIFSSAGPCYYGKIVSGPDPYLPLMHYLQHINAHYHVIHSLFYQKKLWESYVTHQVAFYGSGISAMPSLHIGMAVLFALSGWQINRYLGAAAWVFVFLSLIATIVLGWHSALDGYVGGLLMVALWYAVGWGMRRFCPDLGT